MTSKRLFFRAMKEDLRHKIWMIALSVLGSFLMMPVAWLLIRNNLADEIEAMRGEEELLMERMYAFFLDYYMLCGGFIAAAGAFIVGLFGFRYLFRQGMVDTYHSLPVKRSILFGVCYVDGFLIWFVPAFAGLLSTSIMAGRFAYQMGGGGALGRMLKEAAVSLVVLAVAFLLVYHMVLVAVMLSGNILNALVSVVILGFGALAVFVLGLAFFMVYMESFYIDVFPVEKVNYFSPFFSVLVLLASRCDLKGAPWALWKMILIDSGLAAALLGCAWLLYRRRASELAEQGICSQTAGMVMKVVTGVAAGMCGWQLFVVYVLNSRAVGWGIFGAVLGTVLVFGVLDVIFQMEFAAFFAHKIQMAATLVLALLICFAFYWEWFGYDVYLPEREEIAEIAVYDVQLTNRTHSSAAEDPLENMAFRDGEAIYAYLEAMTATQARLETDFAYYNGKVDWVDTKVTLKDGRSYYRQYLVLSELDSDMEAAWELLSSEEYIRAAYCIDEELAAECSALVLTRNGKSVRLGSPRQEALDPIIRAYNEDVLADPEAALLGKGRLLVRLELVLGKNQGVFTLDIYEDMEHVLEALGQAGHQEWIAVTESTDVRAVALPLRLYVEGSISAEAVIARAGDVYGVYGKEPEGQAQEDMEGQADSDGEEAAAPKEGEMTSGEEEASAAVRETVSEDWAEGDYVDCTIYVTDRAEVEELLALVSYMAPYRGGNVFREEYVEIGIEDVDGNTQTYYIQKGLLPEKYIIRFGEGADR